MMKEEKERKRREGGRKVGREPEFTQHLHNLPNTFRIYPTPSEFTHHLQNLPTPFPLWDPKD